MSNAIKYRQSRKKTDSRYQYSKEGDITIIYVSDNGWGIAVDDIGKIFQRRTRLQRRRGHWCRPISGKRNRDFGRGKIEVESELGKSSTFMVFLKNQV